MTSPSADTHTESMSPERKVLMFAGIAALALTFVAVRPRSVDTSKDQNAQNAEFACHDFRAWTLPAGGGRFSAPTPQQMNGIVFEVQGATPQVITAANELKAAVTSRSGVDTAIDTMSVACYAAGW